MKKIILSLGLLASVAGAAQAQGVKFGIRGGISAVSLSGDDDKFNNKIDNYSYGLAGLGGVTANFMVSDMVSIQPELLYNLRGTQLKDAAGNDSKVRLDLHYIDLPILVKINADGPYFEAGPQVGYLLSAQLGGADKDKVATSSLQQLSLGYVAGVGYQVTDGLSLGIRYNGGISSVGKDNGRYDQQRNQGFNFVVGYEFGGK